MYEYAVYHVLNNLDAENQQTISNFLSSLDENVLALTIDGNSIPGFLDALRKHGYLETNEKRTLKLTERGLELKAQYHQIYHKEARQRKRIKSMNILPIQF